jgi:hypothetical protein
MYLTTCTLIIDKLLFRSNVAKKTKPPCEPDNMKTKAMQH